MEGACHITSRGGGTVGRGICQSLGSGGRNNAAGTQEVGGGQGGVQSCQQAPDQVGPWGPDRDLDFIPNRKPLESFCRGVICSDLSFKIRPSLPDGGWILCDSVL